MTCCPETTRPKLFNVMTVLLVGVWVLMVALAAYSADPALSDPKDLNAFVERLLR